MGRACVWVQQGRASGAGVRQGRALKETLIFSMKHGILFHHSNSPIKTKTGVRTHCSFSAYFGAKIGPHSQCQKAYFIPNC